MPMPMPLPLLLPLPPPPRAGFAAVGGLGLPPAFGMRRVAAAELAAEIALELASEIALPPLSPTSAFLLHCI